MYLVAYWGALGTIKFRLSILRALMQTQKKKKLEAIRVTKSILLKVMANKN